MSPIKILITGGSGLIGQYLNVEMSNYEILTAFNDNPGNCRNYNNVKLNISDSVQMESIFKLFKPEVVIHSAAISSPNNCLNVSPKVVYEVNVNASENIAKLCHLHKSKLIFFSTDLIYDGTRGSMLKEEAKVNPISLYAESKLVAERKIQSTFDNFIILRTALIFGIGLNHSQNHFANIYQNLKDRNEVKLFYDQFRTPLSVIDAARVVKQLVSIPFKGEIINFAGIERVSRFEIGELLCKITGFDKNLIIPTSMYSIPNFPAVEDVSLNTNKLQSLGIKLNNLEDSIKEIIS
jgi:dTDP-4-dehydrorhamnose reductase